MTNKTCVCTEEFSSAWSRVHRVVQSQSLFDQVLLLIPQKLRDPLGDAVAIKVLELRDDGAPFLSENLSKPGGKDWLRRQRVGRLL